MSKRLATADLILAASRELFNKKGYAATTLAEIAAAVGISQGNLSYHFPSKADLVRRMQESVQQTMQSRWQAGGSDSIADDYVEHLLFAMHLSWHNRFLLRDQAQFADADMRENTQRYMLADLEELSQLLIRIEQQNFFLSDLQIDLSVLSRSLWISSRYWMDHLCELEGIETVGREEFERGVQHHFDMLCPLLKAGVRQEFKQTMDTALRLFKRLDFDEGRFEALAGR
jgi:AcrR family transcriptional regulator